MKLETLTEAEKRIPTGVRNTTVLDPSTFTGGWYSGDSFFKKKGIKIRHYSGDPMGYELSDVQERHFEYLSDVLARNGLKFDYLGLAEYKGQAAYNAPNKQNMPTLFRFVMTAPGFVWEKYEGVSAGGGRNTVYVGGKQMKLTEFYRLSPKQQDKLIQAGQTMRLESANSGYDKYIIVGGNPRDKETFRQLEKVAYSVAEQLRSPENGVHAQAGVGHDGWFVHIVINK